MAVIGPNQHIHFDAANTSVLKGLILQSGSLTFDDNQDVHLNVEYIIITDGGKLQIGSEQQPYEHKAQITLYGSVRSIELPIYGSKVLALREGILDVHGKSFGVSWTQLERTAEISATQIVLKDPVDWPINGQIVIASTSDKFSQGESEVREITAISRDKKTLTLNKPLTFEHLAESRQVGSGDMTFTVEIRAEVGLLTRNVIINGFSDPTWIPYKSAKKCPEAFNPDEFATMTCFLGQYGDEIGTDEFGGTIMVEEFLI